MYIINFLLEKSNVNVFKETIKKNLEKSKLRHYSLYFFSGLFLIFVALIHFQLISLGSKTTKGLIGIGVLILATPVLLNVVFPKEELPKPSGKFKIGTRIYELKDKKRDEIYTDVKGDKRKIMYQVWYPTNKTVGYEKAKWISEGTTLTRHLAKSMHVPGFTLDQVADIYSNSFLNAPISNELTKYPVVVISHGWKSFRQLHTEFAEELASNGFIAISIDHTYGSQTVEFDDNEIAYLNPKALPKILNPSKFNQFGNKLIKTFGEDVISVLNDLDRLNSSSDFEDRLDLDEIGLLGHSTGGGGDVYVALKDKRIKAVMGLDAWINPLESKILKPGLRIPALFLSSEPWSKRQNDRDLKKLIRNSHNAELVVMKETKHVDFAMTYMFSPLTKYIGFTGKMGGRYSSKIQREFILEFFEKNLKHDLEIDSEYLKRIVNKYENLEMRYKNN